MRGFAPWPGAYTSFRGQTCHLWAEPFSLRTLTGGAPGTIFREDTQILIACGHATLLRLLSVKLEGRKQISAGEFACADRKSTPLNSSHQIISYSVFFLEKKHTITPQR